MLERPLERAIRGDISPGVTFRDLSLILRGHDDRSSQVRRTLFVNILHCNSHVPYFFSFFGLHRKSLPWWQWWDSKCGNQWIQRKILIKLKTVWYWRLSLSMSWGFEMFWAVGGFWSYLVWCNDRLIPTWQAMFFQGIRRWYRIPHYVSGWYSIAQYRDSQKSQFQGLNIIIAVSTPKSMSWGLVSDGWPRVSTCQSLNHWFSLQ